MRGDAPCPFCNEAAPTATVRILYKTEHRGDVTVKHYLDEFPCCGPCHGWVWRLTYLGYFIAVVLPILSWKVFEAPVRLNLVLAALPLIIIAVARSRTVEESALWWLECYRRRSDSGG